MEKHDIVNTLDHLPIILRVREQMEKMGVRKRGFKFENMWVEKEECEKVINESWLGGSNSLNAQIDDRIKRCDKALMKWNKECFGDVKNRILEKKRELRLFYTEDQHKGDASLLCTCKDELNN